MIVYQTRRQIPTCAVIVEVADQFALFGIHADDGQTGPLKPIAQFGEPEKLLIAVGTEIGGKLL